MPTVMDSLSMLERLLRYCARPPLAMNRLKQRGTDLVYGCGKGHTEPLQSDKYAGELVPTTLELINAPRILPARGPPLRDDCGAQVTGEGMEGIKAEPHWDLANQSPPYYPDDQRTTW